MSSQSIKKLTRYAVISAIIISLIVVTVGIYGIEEENIKNTIIKNQVEIQEIITKSISKNINSELKLIVFELDLLAASNEVKRRIELYWRRESEVVYPPVEVSKFPLSEAKRGDSYVIVSTLVPYKRIELAIEACNKLGKHLKIIGTGPLPG